MRGATAHEHRETQRTGFQSTLPMRGATHRINGVVILVRFQSTLPMRGAIGPQPTENT